MDSRALRVLLMDPTPTLSDGLEDLSRGLGCDTAFCRTMNQSFFDLARFKPHVVIADPRICELGAIGLVRAIGLAVPGCEVVLVDVDPISSIGLEAIQAGALECMLKDDAVPRLFELLGYIAANLPQLEQIMARHVAVAS